MSILRELLEVRLGISLRQRGSDGWVNHMILPGGYDENRGVLKLTNFTRATTISPPKDQLEKRAARFLDQSRVYLLRFLLRHVAEQIG